MLGRPVETNRRYSSPYSDDHFMVVSFSDVPKIGKIVYPSLSIFWTTAVIWATAAGSLPVWEKALTN
jgi:hypothetical protein